MDTFVRLHSMTAIIERRVPGFWQLQFGGWVLLYLLSLAASAPHLRESFIFAYNTWDIVVLFATTLALRPLLRFASQRWSTSWLQLQGRVFCICFLTGSLATYIISLVTFGYRGFRLSYWTLSGVQCSLILFLWAALYLGVRQEMEDSSPCGSNNLLSRARLSSATGANLFSRPRSPFEPETD